jgi:hypothetical protein
MVALKASGSRTLRYHEASATHAAWEAKKIHWAAPLAPLYLLEAAEDGL